MWGGVIQSYPSHRLLENQQRKKPPEAAHAAPNGLKAYGWDKTIEETSF
jgi:hypothetical protein